jgi:hypothetical protein
MPRASTSRPSRSTSAALPSANRRWAPTTPDVGASLNRLAGLYQHQGRYPEAEALYKRAPPSPRRRWVLAIPTSAGTSTTLLYDRAATPEAEPLYKRSLAIRE